MIYYFKGDESMKQSNQKEGGPFQIMRKEPFV